MQKKSLILFSLILLVCVVSGISASSVMADQITIDIPDVEVNVTKDADGYAKFSFSDDRIQFISKTGEPAIPYLIVKTLLPPGADLSTVQVEIKRDAVMSNEIGDTWEVRPTPALAAWDGEKVIILDDNAYNSDGLFPETLVSNISTGAIWEWQFTDIPIALFQYNTVTKELDSIDLSVITLKPWQVCVYPVLYRENAL
ncbi:MAG: hypothetical protein GY749_23275 [Desulfobacteraceae bacterium]|nr:hypothetical protein [Desulfobacteraceae bacterium]